MNTQTNKTEFLASLRFSDLNSLVFLFDGLPSIQVTKKPGCADIVFHDGSSLWAFNDGFYACDGKGQNKWVTYKA